MANNGDWILVHYFNEGFQIHPMHLHGLPGMVVAKDGFALPQPYMADTVLVAPGERYSVLLHADRPGTWASPKSRRNQAFRPGGIRPFGPEPGGASRGR